MSKRIITIGRQCGSGGHTIGKLVAEKLGIPFYDKQLIKIVAQRSGLSEKTVEKSEDTTPSLLYNIAMYGFGAFSAYSATNRDTMPVQDQVKIYQAELIRELADKGPCVIVGRGADYILKDRSDVLNVFIHGKIEDRVIRVINEHGIAQKDAMQHVLDRDKKRARYYKYDTEQTWGLAENYHITLDSSLLGIEHSAEVLCECYKTL